MNKFSVFLDKKNRESKKQLNLLGEALTKNGFKIEKFLKETHDPYIFVFSDKSLSFEGVRIYKINEIFAFKVQYQKDTHPYGTAYDLEVENFFNDYMSEGLNPEESVKKTVTALVQEMKSFFKRSFEMENDAITNNVTKYGLLQLKAASPADYSTTITPDTTS
jgi:hypothetical protein